MSGTMGQAMRVLGAVVLALALAGCGGSEPADLTNFQGLQDTPDEFMVLPTKPLEQPESFASLPRPTPGGRNRVDPTPRSDAYVALGGRPATAAGASSDGAVIAYAGRYGATPGIRRTLAVQDAEFRSQNRGRLLERLFNVNRYFDVYQRQSLDQERELERFRLSGIRTPSAPPYAIEED